MVQPIDSHFVHAEKQEGFTQTIPSPDLSNGAAVARTARFCHHFVHPLGCKRFQR